MAATTKLYSLLANRLQARANCVRTGNKEWLARHTKQIDALVKEHLPSGGGFDTGTKLDMEKSHGEKLVFVTSFHHMDDNGMYDGWTEHTVTVKGSLYLGFQISISGRDRNDIKETIHQAFHTALDTDIKDGA